MRMSGKIGILVICAGLALPSAVLYGAEKKEAEKKESKGATLFQQHCAACHPDGGNIINAAYGLHKKDRDAHGVKTAKEIVGKMRKPGPGMTRFDAKTIPDKEAKEIAEYILKTYK